VIKVEKLVAGYGHLRILKQVSIEVGAGELVTVVGANGAGKSTLLQMLGGVLIPGSGHVMLGKTPVTRRTLPEIRRLAGTVFQDPDDQLFMPTVRDDVAFGPANLGIRGEELEVRVKTALAAVGMDGFEDRAPHHLSFGQRRRVAVATVLAMEPEILVLDEPSSNLDPAGRRELGGILLGLDITILMVTHDLPYALELCPRSVVMNAGVIVADGQTVDVLSDEALMRANRLELPFGFFPAQARAREAG
jgi:cobalt/nickel transport system ATP-binding protein